MQSFVDLRIFRKLNCMNIYIHSTSEWLRNHHASQSRHSEVGWHDQSCHQITERHDWSCHSGVYILHESPRKDWGIIRQVRKQLESRKTRWKGNNCAKRKIFFWGAFTGFLLRKSVSSWGSRLHHEEAHFLMRKNFPPEEACFLLRKSASSWQSLLPHEEAQFLTSNQVNVPQKKMCASR